MPFVINRYSVRGLSHLALHPLWCSSLKATAVVLHHTDSTSPIRGRTTISVLVLKNPTPTEILLLKALHLHVEKTDVHVGRLILVGNFT